MHWHPVRESNPRCSVRSAAPGSAGQDMFREWLLIQPQCALPRERTPVWYSQMGSNHRARIIGPLLYQLSYASIW